MDFHEGTEIGDHLVLVRLLAHGGMANLWRAAHRTLGVDVVVKILSTDPAHPASAIAKERFRREARVTSKVQGPHVVRMLDCDDRTADDNEAPFLVMELLEGEDLSTRLARVGALSIADCVAIIGHVAEALEAADAVGIIHRDVKPENVFLVDTPHGVVAKLIDFGIAKDTLDTRLDLTRTDTTMGTPGYMSPEQILTPRDVDSRCDVWALAVVAYACLTGTTPFHGETYGAVCIAIHGRTYAPPSRERPELSTVDAFFAKAFDLSIDDRHPSARALIDALRDATSETPELTVTAFDALDEVDELLLLGDEIEMDVEENVAFELARPRSRVGPETHSEEQNRLADAKPPRAAETATILGQRPDRDFFGGSFAGV